MCAFLIVAWTRSGFVDHGMNFGNWILHTLIFSENRYFNPFIFTKLFVIPLNFTKIIFRLCFKKFYKIPIFGKIQVLQVNLLTSPPTSTTLLDLEYRHPNRTPIVPDFMMNSVSEISVHCGTFGLNIASFIGP